MKNLFFPGGGGGEGNHKKDNIEIMTMKLSQGCRRIMLIIFPENIKSRILLNL